MPQIFVDGRAIAAKDGQTVLAAAHEHGIDLPAFCHHPALSVAGSCRVCVVQVEGRSWVEIACNMPATEGLRVLTDSELVREHRRSMLELTLLNHPVDCGICDKAGECTLQDYHYKHNGRPSASHDAKVRATKYHPLSSRIVLDNERCILCTRCVRFTHEVSKSHALGIVDRGDHSLVRAVEDGAFERDAYSDNVVDLCPVGALLSRSFLHKARVWYLEATPSVCPGCSRGCQVYLWHRRKAWTLHALDPSRNRAIERVTPRGASGPDGPWICNKGRDLAAIFERPRATQAMVNGAPVPLEKATGAARALLASARKPAALVSSWGSNEELAAFERAFGGRVDARVKDDWRPQPGEVVEDAFLIRADKNPNNAAAKARFPAWDGSFPPGTDLVIVWGEGVAPGQLPDGARVIALDGYASDAHRTADAFIPIAIQTEKRGHYTNADGRVQAFAPCFDPPAGAADAEALFDALAARADLAA